MNHALTGTASLPWKRAYLKYSNRSEILSNIKSVTDTLPRALYLALQTNLPAQRF